MISVRAVVVSYADPSATVRAVESLRSQTVSPGEVVVVDNGGNLSEVDIDARVLDAGGNVGYAAGANRGAEGATSEWLFFLNPDAVASPEAIELLLEAASDRTGAVGCQVLLPDGRVNAGDNPVHLTGLAWSGHFGEEPESSPPREPSSLSGAALMVRTEAWNEVGGLDPAYFLYHDDVDLCLRLRLAGWDLAYQPKARVVHDYEFKGNRNKYFYLERNRWWTMLSVFSMRTLLLLAPVFVAAEVGILLRSAREGWLGEKIRAIAAVGRERTYLRRRRVRLQEERRVPDSALLSAMVASIETPLAPTRGGSLSAPVLESYRRLVVRLSR